MYEVGKITHIDVFEVLHIVYLEHILLKRIIYIRILFLIYLLQFLHIIISNNTVAM